MATKIYTRTGDDGTTSLFGGQRVPKASARVRAYGAVDELNAWLGLCRSMGSDPEMDRWLETVQEDLFTVGAELATPPGGRTATEPLTNREIERLEGWIDQAEAETGALKSFILPGGVPHAAALHVARTVCRRAEREVADLASREPVPPEALSYLNRLSDLLFAMARLAQRRAGGADVTWSGKRPRRT